MKKDISFRMILSGKLVDIDEQELTLRAGNWPDQKNIYVPWESAEKLKDCIGRNITLLGAGERKLQKVVSFFACDYWVDDEDNQK